MTFDLTPEIAEAASGSKDAHLALQVVRQMAAALWAPQDLSDAQRTDLIKSALAALKGIAPQGELEGMLAAQMVATHSSAMECFRRAMIDGQTFEARDLNFKHAEKLSALYARQVETLDKHRGRGQQKITVEHVTVNAGGQAIVGDVRSEAAAPAPAGIDQAALIYAPAPLAAAIEGNAPKPKLKSRQKPAGNGQ